MKDTNLVSYVNDNLKFSIILEILLLICSNGLMSFTRSKHQWKNFFILRKRKRVCNLLMFFLAWIAFLMHFSQSAHSLEPVAVSLGDLAIDLTDKIVFFPEQKDGLTISTVPDANGIVRSIKVRSRNGRETADWAVFALANTSNEQIDRLIVAPHYRLPSSGTLWPDLDAERIVAITPSEGFSLDRLADGEADVFRITLDPGSVITFVAEQNASRLPKLYLWDPNAYKDVVNSYTLYRGIVLGISGLLAVFLTIFFVVRRSLLFPATAMLTWSVLAYICIDFGFWNKILEIDIASQPVWRAGSELFLSASLLIFLYVYLHLNRWHSCFPLIILGWILALTAAFATGIIRPEIAAGIARISFAATSAFGALVIVWLTIKRYDRAIMLIPIWIMVVAWTISAWMTINGDISNDVIQPALSGGITLIVMLLGLTVMQYAFAGGSLAQGMVSDVERQALALVGSSGVVWDWDVGRDVIDVGKEISNILNLPAKTLNGPVKNWINIMHPGDHDKFTAMLEAVVEHKRGRLRYTFRLRSVEGHYYWFELRARPALDSDGKVIRCVGVIEDKTAFQNTQERLLHDALYDNLTGLPNSKLFIKRLETVMTLTQNSASIKPSIFHINIDQFSEINSRFSIAIGDMLLLTISRRLERLLKNGDELARYHGDQFMLMLLSQNSQDKIAEFANAVRKTISAPIRFAGETIELKTSIGIANWTKGRKSASQFIADSELAMMRARQFGVNGIELFSPALYAKQGINNMLLEDFEQALEKNALSIVFQPIVRLSDLETVGYEALSRWKHPKLGNIAPSEFVPMAENAGLIDKLGVQILRRSISEFSAITKTLGNSSLFVTVNISSHELLRHDLVNDISRALKEHDFPAQQLRIELTESLVMRNPEYSVKTLENIKSLGVGLALDDFGTGYSNLAYLMQFPFDIIKIDKLFVQTCQHKDRQTLLQAIITLGKKLGKNLIAEGVETPSDVLALQQLDCEYAQGYLFGKPAAGKKVLALLKQKYKTSSQSTSREKL